MAIKSPLAPVTNPLVSSTQLLHFKSISTPSTPSAHFATFLLTQAAGILLRLPQETIATAIILLQRYLISSASTTSIHARSAPADLHTLSSTALYLSSKLSSIPISPRNLINVYAFLTSPTSSPLHFINLSAPTTTTSSTSRPPDPTTYYISEPNLTTLTTLLYKTESHLLQHLGFNTHVSLPHALALTYLSALNFTPTKPASARLSHRVISHLNAALLSPQYLYLTCQPNILAVGAIYLAAREEGVKLVGGVNWWEVFDVGREELGFVVVALGGLGSWVEKEREGWEKDERGLSELVGVMR